MTDTPSDPAAETPSPRRPQWWPALALMPIGALALTALLFAAQPSGGESRVGMVGAGIVMLPIGVSIYVWLLSTISQRRHAIARTTLAAITTVVTVLGGGIWFGSAFRAPHVRAPITFYDMDPAAGTAFMGFVLCFLWGLILLVAVVVLAILARAADRRDARDAPPEGRPAV